MDHRARRTGCAMLAIALLGGCIDGRMGVDGGGRPLAASAVAAPWQDIAPAALPLSLNSSLFTNAAVLQHHPSTGDFEGYGLAHFRDDNDRSIRLVHIVNEAPLPISDQELTDPNEYQAVVLRTPPDNNSNVRILSRGMTELWGRPLQYQFTSERIYSGPLLPPINIGPADYMSLPGAELRQCVNFVWHDADWVTMLIGNICEYATEAPEPVTNDDVARILQLLDIRVR